MVTSFTVLDESTGYPIQGALCTIYSDFGWIGEAAAGYTNASGQISLTIPGGLGALSWEVRHPNYLTQSGEYPFPSSFTVSLIPSGVPVYAVIISGSEGGNTNPQGVFDASPNQAISVMATPWAGYLFDGWAIDGVQQSFTDNPHTFTVAHDGIEILALFTVEEVTHALVAHVSPAGGGTLNIPEYPKSSIYNEGASVVVIATPASGFSFSHWSGNASGTSNQIIIVMNSYKEIIANFVWGGSVWLTLITGGGVGTGTITQVPTGDPDPHMYTPGTVVRLTAIPDLGFVFGGWRGADNNTINPTTITMNSDKTVTAIFNLGSGNYTLSVLSEGGGSVTLNPLGGIYPVGSSVQLTAVPVAGSAFVEWKGSLTGSVNPATIVMDGNKAITAKFTGGTGTEWPYEFPLTLASALIVKAEGWDLTGKYITLRTFNVPDPSKYLGAKLVYTIQSRDSQDSIWQPDATIDVNAANVVKITQFPRGSIQSGEAYISELIAGTGNRVKLGQSNLPGNWSEFAYTVKVIIGYSEKPTMDPSIDPEGFDWEKYLPYILVGGGVIVAILLLSRGGGGGVTIIGDLGRRRD